MLTVNKLAITKAPLEVTQVLEWKWNGVRQQRELGGGIH